MAFQCTICGEESTRICVWCTKDTCGNHLCQKCGRCSDCCECEVPLDQRPHETVRAHAAQAEAAPEPPAPEGAPPPDPDPLPEPEPESGANV